MKSKAIITTSIIIFLTVSKNNFVFGAAIGKFIFLSGDCQLASVLTGERTNVSIGSTLYAGQKIITQKNSFVEVHLKDKSEILILGDTSIQFVNIRLKKHEYATKMIIDYGKVRIKKDSSFNDKSIEILTPTAVLKSVKAQLALVVSFLETRMLVIRGAVGVANRNYKYKQAYIVRKGEEILVKKNRNPDSPHKSHEWFSELWLKKYKLKKSRIFMTE